MNCEERIAYRSLITSLWIGETEHIKASRRGLLAGEVLANKIGGTATLTIGRARLVEGGDKLTLLRGANLISHTSKAGAR